MDEEVTYVLELTDLREWEKPLTIYTSMHQIEEPRNHIQTFIGKLFKI